MKTKTSRRTIWIRSMLALPLFVLLIYGFSTTEEMQKPLNEVKGTSYSVQEKPDQKKATPEMLREYDSLVNFYNSEENSIIKQRDLEKIDFIYGLMTTEQKDKAVQRKFELVPPLQSKKNIRTQRKATPEMLREYDSLVRHYNRFGDDAIVKQHDWERMNFIHNLATAEQRNKVASREFIPVPPPMPADWAKEKEATPEMIKEYNKLVRRYKSRSDVSGGPTSFDLRRIQHIYGLMTADQKKNAEEFPTEIAPGPAAPESGTETERGEEDVPSPASQSSAQDKKLSLFILGEDEILVNGRKTDVRGFAGLVDKTTEDWKTKDYNLHGLEIRISEDVSENIIDRLNAEFRNTNLADHLNSEAPYIRSFVNADAPAPVPGIETYLTEESSIFLEGKLISAEKALELLRTKREELKISIQQDGENTIITMEYRR